MTSVIILFFTIPKAVLPQCKEQFLLNESYYLDGISNNVDNYYQNLIIQDIALAGQQSFNDISLRFDYTIRYIRDQCTPGLLDIRVLPVTVKCSPLSYYNYDISSSIIPEKADLVFYLVQHDGFISDSLVFFDIPLDKDSSLYTSLSATRDTNDRNISVTFSRAVFHYTKSSYELFRDRILQVDEYYAASMLADSALLWASHGMLSETGNKAEMILRQLEISRIINYIRPEKFEAVYTEGHDDNNGLTARYKELLRLDNRMKAIIHYNHFETSVLSSIVRKNDLLKNYLDRLDYYHQLAYRTDFRFINFIDGLSAPKFSNADLIAFQLAFNQYPDSPGQFNRILSRFIVQGLIDRGGSFEKAGNQPRALTYYESAYDLSRLMNLQDYQSVAYKLFGSMKNNIAASYLEISRKFALAENPNMAIQYFHEAMDIYGNNGLALQDATWLHDYESWLFLNFESQVVKYIELKKYNKALIYLNEILNHCHSSLSYPCPEGFHEWMRASREGIYHDLLQKSQNLLAADELQDAGQAYRQATEMRMRAGYRIEKEKTEDELESKFRQIRYDEFIEDGKRNLGKEEYGDALYYFNKADFEERGSILHPCLQLFSYRQTAARYVMEGILSDGRLKAWAYDFEGAGRVLAQVKMMLSEYRFPQSDNLAAQYTNLENSIHQNQCEKIFREYNDLMLMSKEAKEKNDFILALNVTNEAVNISMDHIDCRIRDDDAWYQKVLLESPADFQQKENELDNYHGSCNDYLKAFQDLKSFYNRNRLLEQGVVFIPLYERVIKSEDSLFLTDMLGHYLKLKEYDNALHILDRLRELGYQADPLADQQKSVAEALARRDAVNPDPVEPWIRLESYTGHNKWYQDFRHSYKIAWLRATNWKLKYWPFIWKK
jgi:hypothetical protein